ncbi:DUF4260 domain-containing protein [Lentibacillus sp. CBA3610]|uniref:DUF4260 domain-containing protein n=1 Tax=Lentibacillus sp. CBA3610 TaxID=2518176 RepID=UPI001596314A|nr:DUF4260 domain-containing protein [Lentibacillus sp. CBA3610]QKY68362.1 DUF4260 family protein [Lentibacillus sp. CBA3610]
MNRFLLHIEGFMVLLLTLSLYAFFEFSWLLFFVLLLAPDISMLGYLISNKAGAWIYNLFHTYSMAIAVVLCGLLFVNAIVLAIGLIWTAHIGMDRMIGYGLKYPSGFNENHLNRL